MTFVASDIRFKHPFTCIIGGPTGCGKSTLCIRFLQNLDTLCSEPDFLWCNYLVLQRTERGASTTVGRVKKEPSDSRGSTREL